MRRWRFSSCFEFVLAFLFTFYDWMGIDPDPRITDWLTFVLILPLGFGISFQLPLVMLFLERIGIFTTKTYLSNWRISVLVICFIAMVLTPSDPYSMVLMAMPAHRALLLRRPALQMDAAPHDAVRRSAGLRHSPTADLYSRAVAECVCDFRPIGPNRIRDSLTTSALVIRIGGARSQMRMRFGAVKRTLHVVARRAR